MRGIWAVARYTLAQCLRTKLAAAFIAVLAVTLVALALTVTGDGTLGGRIRTFLAYSTAAVSILLSFVTILLGVGVVAGDVRARHVFLLVVKPLPRWQYIVGRWGGIVLLDAALLAVACGSIYAVAQHLRTREALNHNDRVAVETEVFAARAEVRPEPVIDELVARARQRDGGEGFEQSWREYQRSEGLSEPEAKRRAEKDLREAIADQLRSIGPGQSRRWRLAGIEPGAAPVTGRARLRSRAVEYHAEVRPTTPELRPLLEEP
ncbi:MAG: ABC transporter permease, partial [Planctomycetota bacterium]